MYFYRDILTRAWSFTKSHRWLWIFGFFTALIAGNGGEIDIYFKNLQSITAQDSFLSPSFWLNNTWAKGFNFLLNNFNLHELWPALSLALFVVLACLLIWLIVSSQTALIYSTGQQLANQEISFKEALKNSQGHWLSMFILNLLNKIVVYGFLLVFAVPWLAYYAETGQKNWLITYLVISFIILVPLAIILSFLVKYTAGYIILEKKHLIPAFISACKLFYNNWLVSLEMAGLLFILNLLVSFSVSVVVLLLISPFVLFSALSGLASDSFAGILFFAFVGFIFLTVAVIFVGAIFSAFQWSAWTLLFAELKFGRGQAKLVRWFQK